MQVGAVVCDNGKWVTGQEPSSPSFSCLQNQAATLPCAAMHKKVCPREASGSRKPPRAWLARPCTSAWSCVHPRRMSTFS